jgi:Domain of unknown function (DUF1707)
MSNELRPSGGYRVGDAERARTADLLKEAHVAGYLSLNEIDERLGAALAARTRDDLDRLVADLPPEWLSATSAGAAPVPDRAAAPPVRSRRGVPPAAWVFAPLALLVVAMVVLGMVTHSFFPWPLLWVWFFFGRRHLHGHRHGDWRNPRSNSNRVTWV